MEMSIQRSLKEIRVLNEVKYIRKVKDAIHSNKTKIELDGTCSKDNTYKTYKKAHIIETTSLSREK